MRKRQMKKDDVKQLFMQHYARMYAVARSILYDADESKDVVSDIFADLLDKDVLLLPDSAERYLLTSVRNRCIKRLRHADVRQRFERLLLSDAQAERLSDDDEAGLDELLDYAESHLSAQELSIFRQRFVEGSSYDDIASAEGISRVAVWKHLSHLIKTISQHFNPSKR